MEKISMMVMGLLWTLKSSDGQTITIGFNQDQRWEVVFKLMVPLRIRREVREWQLWPYGMCGVLRAKLQGEVVEVSVDYLGWLDWGQGAQRSRRILEGEISLEKLEKAVLKLTREE